MDIRGKERKREREKKKKRKREGLITEKLDASTSSSRNINGSRKWESWKALNKSCIWMGLKYEIRREKVLVFIYLFFVFWEI